MNWPHFNSHHDVECFTHPPRPTCSSTCLGARLCAWLSPQHMPSPGSLKENSALLFTGLPVSLNLPSLHSPSPMLSPNDLILHCWSWCDIDSGAPLLIPLKSRILDHQRLAGPTNRDTDRATRLHPHHPCFFVTKALNMAGLSPGARGHYERLSVIIPARGPRQRVTGNFCSAALFVRRMLPQRTTSMITFCGCANTPC